jgi:hypothetical protein
MIFLEFPTKSLIFSIIQFSNRYIINEDKAKEYDLGTYYEIDMHPDLGEPVEQLGIEMEPV